MNLLVEEWMAVAIDLPYSRTVSSTLTEELESEENVNRDSSEDDSDDSTEEIFNSGGSEI